jgi:hypothetical protein
MRMLATLPFLLPFLHVDLSENQPTDLKPSDNCPSTAVVLAFLGAAIKHFTPAEHAVVSGEPA